MWIVRLADRRNRVLAEAEFVDRIGVQVHRESRCGRRRSETAVDDRRRGAEILMHLHRHRARRDQFFDRCRMFEPPLPNSAKFSGECSVPAGNAPKVVVLPLPTSNTGPGLPPISVVVPPASACSDCSGDWMCAWHSMAPAVNDEGCAGDGGRCVADDQIRMDARHDVGIAGLADADDAPVADADVGLSRCRVRHR